MSPSFPLGCTSRGEQDEQHPITLSLGTDRRGICHAVHACTDRTCAIGASGDTGACRVGSNKLADRRRRTTVLQAVESRAACRSNNEIFWTSWLHLRSLGLAYRSDSWRAVLAATRRWGSRDRRYGTFIERCSVRTRSVSALRACSIHGA